MPESQYTLIPHKVLSDFSAEVFMHFGVSETDARQAADV